MKRLLICFCLTIACISSVLAQDNDLLLAKQFAANGEEQKALDIYQRLYKQDNEQYFGPYVNTLLELKKFDEAEGLAKKMIRKHPGDQQYVITLGTAYTQQGAVDKANALYDEMIKN